MKRADLPAGGIEFTTPGILAGMHFIRFPIHVPLPDNAVGFVNDAERKAGAVYREGQWRDMRNQPLKWVPTHWTVMLSEDGSNGE